MQKIVLSKNSSFLEILFGYIFRRIRDKYEAEFIELENSEKQTKERFNQIKGQITEVQG
jgi:hypothetical protein